MEFHMPAPAVVNSCVIGGHERYSAGVTRGEVTQWAVAVQHSPTQVDFGDRRTSKPAPQNAVRKLCARRKTPNPNATD
jgi:hypothetical protein